MSYIIQASQPAPEDPFAYARGEQVRDHETRRNVVQTVVTTEEAEIDLIIGEIAEASGNAAGLRFHVTETKDYFALTDVVGVP